MRALSVLALSMSLLSSPAYAAAVTVTVDATANRHAIDPRIYGAAFADNATILDLGITMNRWGGNRATRYNWMTNRGNTANDYCFYNVDETDAFGLGTADDFVTR